MLFPETLRLTQSAIRPSVSGTVWAACSRGHPSGWLLFLCDWLEPLRECLFPTGGQWTLASASKAVQLGNADKSRWRDILRTYRFITSFSRPHGLRNQLYIDYSQSEHHRLKYGVFCEVYLTCLPSWICGESMRSRSMIDVIRMRQDGVWACHYCYLSTGYLTYIKTRIVGRNW